MAGDPGAGSGPGAVGNVVDKLYHALLWFLGMNEHITDQLRRTKKRLGIWWYILSLGTIVGVNALLWWLFWHIHEHP